MKLDAKLQIPEVFEPLLRPCRYKVPYGGRGSAKSHSVGRVLLHQATADPLRVLCCREIMKTISDSVHRTLTDLIVELALQDFYHSTETSIVGQNGAEFIYAGLRTLDAAKIKSYEGVDIAWVEEAHNVSQKSWDTLIPTIRADGSEIWATFNPELDSDETYKRFVVSPPSGAWVQKVTYRDNPWFPQVLEDERQEFLRQVKAGLRSQEDYDNIWEGACRTVVQGAIYAKEVMQMIEGRRIRPLPYDPKLPVHTIWDLGWNDQTSIIFVQRLLSEVRIIDYEEASFLTYAQWAKKLAEKDYLYGDHWLPHDGGHKTQQAGGASAQEQLKPLLKSRPKIIKQTPIESQIKSARMMLPRVYMDEDRTKRLQECLKRYRRAVPESTGEPGAPIHDEYSHGASAFQGLSLIVDQLRNERNSAPIVKPYESLDREIGM